MTVTDHHDGLVRKIISHCRQHQIQLNMFIQIGIRITSSGDDLRFREGLLWLSSDS